MTARRVGWLGCCTATGLLLQIAVQIKLLSWLQDFPVYDMLASFAGILVLGAAPMCLVRASTAERIAGALFFLATIAHFTLTLLSSSSVYLFWRDMTFWPALALGLLSCSMTPPVAEFPGQRLFSVVALVWMLGEVFTSPAAIFVATSAGESTNFATYRFVIYAAWLTTLIISAAWLIQVRMQREPVFRNLTIAAVAGSVALSCPSLLPGPIGTAMLVLAGIRVLVVLIVVRNVAAVAQEKAAGADPAANEW